MKARAYVPPEGASGNGEDRGEGYVPPGVSGSEKPRFELIAFDDVRIDTAPAYRIKGILAAFGLCVVWGPPKCGKSFLVFDMVMHVALGWKYRGKKVRQGSVVYCVLEGCKPFKNRIEAFRQKWLAKHARPVPFHLMASPMTLVADHLELIASIKRQCPNPAVVVIDTLNRSLAGSESNDEDMSAYVKAADAIKDAFNCAVIIVHHCGHEGTRPRGHSSLPGALDVELAVKRNAADNIIAILELMKDGQQGEEWASRLTVVKVGTDDDGDEITSCVIEAVEGAAKTKGKTTRLPVRRKNRTSRLARGNRRPRQNPTSIKLYPRCRQNRHNRSMAGVRAAPGPLQVRQNKSPKSSLQTRVRISNRPRYRRNVGT